ETAREGPPRRADLHRVPFLDRPHGTRWSGAPGTVFNQSGPAIGNPGDQPPQATRARAGWPRDCPKIVTKGFNVLIECPECKAKVSDTAASCPSCGALPV